VSLVNDMLNDLEKRRTQSTQENVKPDWSVGQMSVPVSKRNSQRVFIYSLLVVLLLGFLGWQYNKITVQPTAVTTIFDTPEKSHGHTPVEPIAPIESIESIDPVEAFSVDTVNKSTEVTLMIKGDFQHEVSTQLGEKPSLVVAILPDASQALATQKESTLLPKKAMAKTAMKPIALAPVKKIPVLTAEQKDSNVANQAAAMIAKGELAGSEAILKSFLQQQSSTPKSSEMYVSLLLSQRRVALAQGVLDGLSLADAKTPNFVVMQARLYLLSAKAQQSVELLMRSTPSVRQYPEYYELLAQSAQRAKHYLLSEKTYRALIATHSRRGDWWVGLGISLDAQGRSKQAANAYRQALKTEQINQSLRTYAQQRLTVL
jgi:hypothetical protein